VLEANYNEMSLTSAICSAGLRPNTLAAPLEDARSALINRAITGTLLLLYY
jgi:hypothetical protein